MTFKELYYVNSSWERNTEITIKQENHDIDKVGFAHELLEDTMYCDLEVICFKENVVFLEERKIK